MKISYIIHHGVGEWERISQDSSDTLLLTFKPECSGAVDLGGAVFTVKNGDAEIPLNALPDGEYQPKLECEIGVYTAESFLKHGRSVSLPKTDEAVLRRLILRCYDLEKDRDALEERIARLETLCQGHNIFNF